MLSKTDFFLGNKHLKKYILSIFLTLGFAVSAHAQLGFCPGSKGEPIFTENFGTGTNYGPQLPAGTTTYTFVLGAPQDGQYTLHNNANQYSTWHVSPDHTPDDVNGKMLLMNANAVTSGDFYKKTVTGLCVNTTFEFSAWLMNVYNPNTNYCGAGQIPINVRFEIWNENETVLLGSGNTGNIFGSPAPLWQQFALVFTTTNETTVVLKMKNNGLGGCGNDLAIDDISFSACGDLTTVSNTSGTTDVFSTCENPVSIQLNAATQGAATYFYQWQISNDNINWTSIPGATNASYTTPNMSSTTYFRTKAAQDAANLNSGFCSSISNVFTVDFLPLPMAPTSSGNQVICADETLPILTVTTATGTAINWYDASVGGNLLLADSASYTPTTAGTFYAEAYNLTTNCISATRTAVSLSIAPVPTATISGSDSICSGSTATINFAGTPNAIITFTVNGGPNQSIALDASGSASLTTGALTSIATYNLVNVAAPDASGCTASISGSAQIQILALPIASITATSPICSGTTATLQFSGTAGATVTFSTSGGPTQAVILDASGNASVNTALLTTDTTFTLISVMGTNGCSQALSSSVTIQTVSLPTAAISVNPATVCSGGSSTLEFTGTPNAVVNYVSGGQNHTVTLDSTGNASVGIAGIISAQTYQLVSVALAGSGCSEVLSASATINVNPTPIVSFSGDVTLCEGEPLSINLSSNIPGTTFGWTVTQTGISGASDGTGDQISQQILLTSDASGTAIYTVTPTFNGCSGAPVSIQVNVSPLPMPQLNDGVICRAGSGNAEDQFVTLDTQLPAQGHTFQWFLGTDVIAGATSNTYNATEIGTYSVIVTNAQGCVSNAVSATVSEREQGESLVITQSPAFSENQSVTVTVVGGNEIFYYQMDNGSWQTSNIFTSVQPGTHTITVVDDFCTYLTTIVTIIDFPKYFTPNADGFNDYWNIDDIGAAKITIFDRYGKLIKQINANGPGWDGSYGGQPAPSNDYWFIVEFVENGVRSSFRSHFALKR